MKKPNGFRSTSYDVGYRKPPKNGRYRKGRSGNPRGRTQGEENLLSIFKRIADRRVKVHDGTKARTMSLAEAIILQNYKAAVQKDPTAMGNIWRLAEHAGEFKDLNDPKVAGRPIFMPRKVSSEEEFNAENGASTVEAIPSRTYGARED